jgi:putative tryptophan/tyrosine transport system substrate-binding protein
MNRRQVITLLGGAAVAWPVEARAQQPHRIWRIGVLMAIQENDPERQVRITALKRGLEQAGWIEGYNVQIDVLRGGGTDNIRKNAAEMVASAPDIILCSGTASLTGLLQVTRTVPIVFVNVADPVGAGFVESLAEPGGNATGFMQFEYSLSGKWPELLKEIAPGVTRVAVLRDATLTAGIGQFAVIQSVAQPLGLEVRPVNVSDLTEIERAMTALARRGKGGLICTVSAASLMHRDRIVALTIQYKIPAVFNRRIYVNGGGLISYGPDTIDQFRQVATYIDRIFKGDKPADLPVQAPTKYELVINLQTAKAMAIEVPPSLLARADEVIE